MKAIFLTLVCSLTSHAQILRLSNVVPQAGPEITRFEIVAGDETRE